jgi:hypothetical protein
MHTVWSQFTRKNRRTGQYLHPTLITLNGQAESARRQDFALVLLFALTHALGEDPPQVMLQREFEAKQEERKATAIKLWAEAEAAWGLEEAGGGPSGRAKILAAAGDELFRMSGEPPIGKVMVERDRGERNIQGTAMTIAGACKWLFGSPFYSVSATLTSVVLDRPVTARKVREWGPALPSADKGGFFGLLSAGFKP